MKIISTKDIKEALKSVKPEKVAVAYLGLDWDTFIDDTTPLEIIISPTLGTNPKAVLDIVEKKGWSNVHFLNNLHTKLYIGADKAAFGSFNLSRNGIDSESGSEELGVITGNKEQIDLLNVEFERLLKLAKHGYRTVESKKERLKTLRSQINRAYASGQDSALLSLDENANKPVSLKDYNPNDNKFLICWYIHDSDPIDYAAVKETTGGEISENDIETYTTVLPEDKVEADSWVLQWRINNNGEPHKTDLLSWLYVHRVLPNTVKVEDAGGYTISIIQLKDKKPPEPFDLEEPGVQQVLKNLLMAPDFKGLRRNDDELWSVEKSRGEIFENFIRAAQKALQDIAKD